MGFIVKMDILYTCTLLRTSTGLDIYGLINILLLNSITDNWIVNHLIPLRFISFEMVCIFPILFSLSAAREFCLS